jgi:hypothetical protein
MLYEVNSETDCIFFTGLFYDYLNPSGAIILFSLLIEMWEKSSSFRPSPGSLCSTDFSVFSAPPRIF